MTMKAVDLTEKLGLISALWSPKIVAQVKEGKLKAAGALIGQAKQKNPDVNPAQVREICLKLIEEWKMGTGSEPR